MLGSEKGRTSRRLLTLCLDIIIFAAGGALYGVSLSCFTAANNIAPGGFSGLAVIISHLTALPIGALTFVLNLPLFLIGMRKIGYVFLGKTVTATLIMSVMVDLAERFLPKYRGDTMLAALFGGVLAGAGLSLILMRGGTSGGTDILAKLLRRKFPFIPMGRLIILLDVIVIALSALVFRNLETALFAAVSMFASGQVIDNILYGADRGKAVYIISHRYAEIAQRILHSLQRGVTLMEAEGAYSGQEQRVILCAVRRHQVAKLHAIIKETDPGAFVIVTEAGEILGSGFRGYQDST